MYFGDFGCFPWFLGGFWIVWVWVGFADLLVGCICGFGRVVVAALDFLLRVCVV